MGFPHQYPAKEIKQNTKVSYRTLTSKNRNSWCAQDVHCRTLSISDSCSHGALARLGPRPGWMASPRSGGHVRGVTAAARVMLIFYFELHMDQNSWQLQLIIDRCCCCFKIFLQTLLGASLVFVWVSMCCKCQNWNFTGNQNGLL